MDTSNCDEINIMSLDNHKRLYDGLYNYVGIDGTSGHQEGIVQFECKDNIKRVNLENIDLNICFANSIIQSIFLFPFFRNLIIANDIGDGKDNIIYNLVRNIMINMENTKDTLIKIDECKTFADLDSDREQKTGYGDPAVLFNQFISCIKDNIPNVYKYIKMNFLKGNDIVPSSEVGDIKVSSLSDDAVNEMQQIFDYYLTNNNTYYENERHIPYKIKSVPKIIIIKIERTEVKKEGEPPSNTNIKDCDHIHITCNYKHKYNLRTVICYHGKHYYTKTFEKTTSKLKDIETKGIMYLYEREDVERYISDYTEYNG